MCNTRYCSRTSWRRRPFEQWSSARADEDWCRPRTTGRTLSCLWPDAGWSSDHAGLPVMMPRQSDGEMRRDGSSAADVQPKYPVAERGRVHGVPGFSSGEALRVAAKREVVLSSEKDKRRWRKRARDPDRLRGQDKGARCAPLFGCAFSRVYAANSRGAPDRRSLRLPRFSKIIRAMARCAGSWR